MRRNSQKAVDTLADLTWVILTGVFRTPKKKRPPVYLFLSPKSRGSLKTRSIMERAFVHRQQVLGGGVTLKKPPTAWVSEWSQVPEETAHLFAIVHKNLSKKSEESIRSLIYQEAFGHFAEILILGKIQDSIPKSQTSVWHLTHREGTKLGKRLALQFLQEKKPLPYFRSFFWQDWTKPRPSR